MNKSWVRASIAVTLGSTYTYCIPVHIRTHTRIEEADTFSACQRTLAAKYSKVFACTLLVGAIIPSERATRRKGTREAE
jgi:hypothetical protein